jgi:hypothetical protein
MLTKHDERKMPKNLGHIASLARSYTDTAIKTLAGIMMEPSAPARARIAAAAILLDRGWGKAKEMHEHSSPDSNPIKKIVHEFVYMPPPGQNVTIDNALPADDEPVLIGDGNGKDGAN